MQAASLLLADALERLAVLLHVHEPAGLLVPLDPLLGHRVGDLRPVPHRTVPVPVVSPGASKPATHGRFKTSHNSYGFRTRSLILTGSTRCSKCQARTGLLFHPGSVPLGPAAWPLSGPPARPQDGSESVKEFLFRPSIADRSARKTRWPCERSYHPLDSIPVPLTIHPLSDRCDGALRTLRPSDRAPHATCATAARRRAARSRTAHSTLCASACHSATARALTRPRTVSCTSARPRAKALTHSAVAARSL